LDEWKRLKKLQKDEGFQVTMICCNSPGHLRNSTKGLQFFYHKVKPVYCSWERESPEHEEMKYAIYKICKSEGWEVFTEFQSPNNDWRADVYAIKGTRRIVFEVQFSKICQTDLQTRDQKYAKDSIESYWLLKDFFGYDSINYWDVLSKRQQFPDDVSFENDPDFLLSHEKYYFILKNIRSIGINPETELLFSSQDSSIPLELWIKSCLTGEYAKYLENGIHRIKHKMEQFEKWKPVLNNIDEKTTTLRNLQNRAIIELPKLHLYISQNDIKTIYLSLDDLHQQLIRIISIKEKFYIKKRVDNNCSSTNSDNDISPVEEIGKLLVEYSKSEFNVIQSYHDIIKEAQLKHNKAGIQAASQTKKSVAKFQKDAISCGQKAIFQFNNVLPLENNYLIALNGNKYQNPCGCKWSIVELDAIEFQKKGYGKIVEEYVRVRDD